MVGSLCCRSCWSQSWSPASRGSGPGCSRAATIRHRRRRATCAPPVRRTSQPTISKHLRVLREAGFVSRRVAAQQRIYR
ncbi:MAG: ArsR family transcriptional regulator, partial [Sporichthyaceae bacterium]|nr:ArsR family transcriptional regulator [Sporichthyaceae bacterium]